MQHLVVASGNAHKLAEIRAVLLPRLGQLLHTGRPAHDLILSLDDAAARSGTSLPPEPDETAPDFLGNARLKARAYAAALRLPCLADDSGLEVDALQGAPGVFSARYAAPPEGWPAEMPRAERDQRNNDKLLRALDAVPEHQRTARFVCALSIADPEGNILAESFGRFEGRIGIPPRVPAGSHGFGYDPLFLVAPVFDRTSAELSPDEKNAQSHRARALHDLAHRITL